MATGQTNRVIEHIRKTIRARDTAEISDGQLLECFVVRREERGFELLLQRHGPMVLSVCKRVLRSHQDAEDAFQATFLVLARKASSIRPRERVGNWLYGVACKTALRARSVLAKRQVREKLINPLPEREVPPQDSWPEVQRLLDEELRRLSDKYRVPILLCDLEGKSQKEAAQHLGVPEGTLSSRLSRGRAMLAKRLARRGFPLSAVTLAGMLSPNGVSAGVSPALASATLQAARAFAAGQSVAGLVSSTVVSSTEGVLKAMLWTKLTNVVAAFLVVACFALGGWVQLPSATGQADPICKAESQAVQPRGPTGKGKDRAQGFDDLSPAARFQLVRKLTDPEKEFQATDRGDVISSITAHGSLASAHNGDIYCQVRSSKSPYPTITVKSVVDNGTHVRKGEVLVRLDDCYWQEQLQVKGQAYQRMRAAVAAAETALERGKLQTELRELDGEIALRAAELKLKKYAGNDPDEKALLKLEVQKARLWWQLVKLEGKSRMSLSQADLQTKMAIAKVELAELDDIKEQIKKCTIKAPKDGVVYYYIPEGTKANNASQVLAPGEPVREGQKLLQIPDLEHMVASIRVPEALVASLRGEDKDKSKWQAALIRVDAYPNLVLKGHVQFVDTVAAADSFLAGQKVYKTRIAIDKDQNAKMPRLLPGMSAEVTIVEVARKNGVVRLPVQAVVPMGQGHYCYVKIGKEILKREVTLGLRGQRFVEIKSGIQEDDIVVREVNGLARQLSPFLGPRKE